MKKILLLASVAMIGSHIAAQVTITSNHVIHTGQKITQYHDQSSTISLKAGASTSQTFDFSNLIPEDSTKLNFFNPDWKPSVGNLVAGANLVAEGDGDFTFLKKTSTSLKFVGSAFDTGAGPLAVGLYEIPVMYFPMSYGTVVMDSTIISAEKTFFGMSPGMGAPVIDSFEIIYKMRFTFKGVGHGSVKLPNNLAIDNALMIESTTENYVIVNYYTVGKWSTLPTIYYNFVGESPDPDSSFSHIWWTTKENYGFPLVQYQFYPGDNSTDNVDYISSDAKATATRGTNIVSVSVYPNPSANVLLFNGLTNTNATAMVMDMQGKTVLSTTLENNKLDISQLSAGNYLVNVTNGEEMIQIKITKD